MGNRFARGACGTGKLQRARANARGEGGREEKKNVNQIFFSTSFNTVFLKVNPQEQHIVYDRVGYHDHLHSDQCGGG
jgi:hypothetical protein